MVAATWNREFEQIKPLLESMSFAISGEQADAKTRDQKLDEIQERLAKLLKQHEEPPHHHPPPTDIGLTGRGYGFQYDGLFQRSSYALGTIGVTGHETLVFGQGFAIDGGSNLALDDMGGFSYDVHLSPLLGWFGQAVGLGFGATVGSDGVNVFSHAPRLVVDAGFYVGPSGMIDAPLGESARIFADAHLSFRTNTSTEAGGDIGFMLGKWDDSGVASFFNGVYVGVGYRRFPRIDLSGYSVGLGYRTIVF